VDSPGAHPNRLGCNIPARSCLVQSQVYEVRGGKPVDQDGVTTNEQFAKGGQALPKFVYFLPIFRPSCLLVIYVATPQMAQKREQLAWY